MSHFRSRLDTPNEWLYCQPVDADFSLRCGQRAGFHDSQRAAGSLLRQGSQAELHTTQLREAFSASDLTSAPVCHSATQDGDTSQNRRDGVELVEQHSSESFTSAGVRGGTSERVNDKRY